MGNSRYKFNPIIDRENKNWRRRVTIKEALKSVKKAKAIGIKCLNEPK